MDTEGVEQGRSSDVTVKDKPARCESAYWPRSPMDLWRLRRPQYVPHLLWDSLRVARTLSVMIAVVVLAYSLVFLCHIYGAFDEFRQVTFVRKLFDGRGILALLILASSESLIVLLARHRAVKLMRSARDRTYRICPNCSYDISARESISACPECGREYDQQAIELMWRNLMK